MSPHLSSVHDNAPAATYSAPNGTEVIERDLLIIGAGPAGASLACFLGSYGMTSLVKKLVEEQTMLKTIRVEGDHDLRGCGYSGDS